MKSKVLTASFNYKVINIILLFIIFIPLIKVLISIFRYTISSNFTNFNQLFSSRILNLFYKSLLISILVVLFSTFLSVVLSFLFEKYKFSFSKIFKVLAVVPILVPSNIYAISWIYIIGEQGWLNNIFRKIFHLSSPPFTIYGLWGTIFCLTIWIFPLNMLFLSSAIKQNGNLNDAAKLCSSRFTRFFRISLQLAKPGLISGMIFTFIICITNFSVPGVLRLNVFPVEIFTQFGAFFDHSQAMFFALPLIITTMVILYYYKSRQFDKNIYSIKNEIVVKKKVTSPINLLIVTILLVFFTIVLGFPIITLLIKSGNLSVYLEVLDMSGKQIINTIFIGLIGATILTITGFNFAYFNRNLRGIIRDIFDFILLIPISIPGLIFGISLIHIWNNQIFSRIIYGTFVIILLSYFRLLPLSYYISKASLHKIPAKFEEAAVVAGKKRSAILKKITLPLSLSGILNAFFISLIYCFGELDSSVLVNPPGFETLNVRIFSLLHYGATDKVAALCIIQILLILLIVFSGWKWIGRLLNVRN